MGVITSIRARRQGGKGNRETKPKVEEKNESTDYHREVFQVNNVDRGELRHIHENGTSTKERRLEG